MRNRTFLSTSVRFVLAAAAVVPIVVACGGREVSLGSNHSALSTVDPGNVSGTVPSCGSGAAHPNVCCEAGPGKPAKCGSYDGEPFHPCDDGWKTYPDPRSCCDLDDPTKCTAPPPAPPPPAGSCGYQCPPGWYGIGGGGCCRTTDDGGDGECFAPGNTGDAGTPADAGFDDGGPISIDGGCAPTDDASVDSGCNEPPPPPLPPPTPIDAGQGPPPPPPPCNVQCPMGWQPASGAPDVCCRETAPNQFECFSQSTGPDPGPTPTPAPNDAGFPPPPSTDAGPPPPIDAGGAPRVCGGSSNGDCSCQVNENGHSYMLSCSDTTMTCDCSADGVVTVVNNVKVCSNMSALDSVWTSDCHFP
jgi:hypothetical protein